MQQHGSMIISKTSLAHSSRATFSWKVSMVGLVPVKNLWIGWMSTKKLHGGMRLDYSLAAGKALT